ncbi:MAG TPA: MFS transporter [Aliidongia sp.]|uniref:MFS transporter n=1 Tax=Aliidongia sp. TaxID=1914230 RepID=UPI002DDCD569|nr:MFS transporter [Aliidongia sp.]HEV2676386.1 MFS transporter [Aliidongia sp.]
MQDREDRAIKKAAWRLLPLLILLYLVAYIDRQNVSFAKLQMLGSLGMSEAAYGLGASLFFIGYLIFEIPSNMALHRFGARRWIARIMLTWGLVTIALAWTSSATMFYVLRFLLGAAEAGLYPGVIYYMTLWFPERYRVRVVGYFTLGSSLGNMVGALINGVLLDLNGLFGLEGWRWVFLVTGIAPVVLTFVTWRLLPDGPGEARFLDPAEREAIRSAVRRDAPKLPRHGNPFAVLTQGRIFVLAFFYTMISMSIYGIGYWLPTVVKGFGVTSTVNGLLNMIPWFLTSLVLLWLPGRLQTPGTILRCVGLAVIVGILCFCISTFAASPMVRLAALALGAPCLYVMIPCFWSVPARLLTGAQAAAGIAAINSLGNIGGFVGQNIMPWVKDTTGSDAAPMLVPAACLAVLGLGAILASRSTTISPAVP